MRHGEPGREDGRGCGRRGRGPPVLGREVRGRGVVRGGAHAPALPRRLGVPEVRQPQVQPGGGQAEEAPVHAPRLQFSVTSGTPMRGSRLPLPKWFLAFRLVAGSKRGVSAAELARALGTSETTARYVALRLRGAMSDGLGRLRPGLGRGRG